MCTIQGDQTNIKKRFKTMKSTPLATLLWKHYKNTYQMLQKSKIFKNSDLKCQRDSALHIVLDPIQLGTVPRQKQEKYKIIWGYVSEINGILILKYKFIVFDAFYMS